jgi:hypothetical protein
MANDLRGLRFARGCAVSILILATYCSLAPPVLSIKTSTEFRDETHSWGGIDVFADLRCTTRRRRDLCRFGKVPGSRADVDMLQNPR